MGEKEATNKNEEEKNQDNDSSEEESFSILKIKKAPLI